MVLPCLTAVTVLKVPTNERGTMPRTNIHREALAAIGNLNDIKEALELNHMPTWLIDEVTALGRCSIPSCAGGCRSSAADQAFGFQMGLRQGLDRAYAADFQRSGVVPEELLDTNTLHWFKQGQRFAQYIKDLNADERRGRVEDEPEVQDYCRRCDGPMHNGYCTHCEHECGNDCDDRRCRNVGCDLLGCEGECRDDEERRWCNVCQDYAPRFCDCPRPVQTRRGFIHFSSVPSMRI